ncbi:MAG: hypothetical protein CMH83_19030 [Nocardioides sp.]|nr:hypothetical protein [Nocardioides sp.]
MSVDREVPLLPRDVIEVLHAQDVVAATDPQSLRDALDAWPPSLLLRLNAMVRTVAGMSADEKRRAVGHFALLRQMKHLDHGAKSLLVSLEVLLFAIDELSRPMSDEPEEG